MKIRIMILTAIMIMATATVSHAKLADVSNDAGYANSVNRLEVFGIMKGDENGNFNPDQTLTREQFAKIIVVSAGLEDEANALKGSTVFPDISNKSWSCGYINEALSKGYISGMPDGKFHPKDKVTFAQACTVVVRALGYSDSELKGFWPDNYIEKAKSLGLTDGISLNSTDGISRWAIATMVNSLLSTNVKKANANEQDQTFALASELYSIYTVLGTNKTMDKLPENQILTDKGTLYLADGIKDIEAGIKYELYVKNEKVLKVFNKLNSVRSMAVESASENKIKYYDTDGSIKSMVLPDKTVYYYNGVKQNYDNLKSIIQTNSSIVLSSNENNTGYDYAFVFDPVYSDPEIGSKLDISKNKIGKIEYNEKTLIIRDNELSKVTNIEKYDVCYKITDIWGGNGYILVIDNQIEGKLKGFLPSKASAKQIQIDAKTYDLSSAMDATKVRNSTLKIDEDIIALCGVDGKVVEVVYSIDNEVNYGFVLNFISNSMNTAHTVKLLLPNNITVLYDVPYVQVGLKGCLVKYKMTDEDTVSIEGIEYSGTGDFLINKEDKIIDTDYVDDNVKIYNVMSNEADKEAVVEILDWKDIPYGKIQVGRIVHLNKDGEFGDINLVVASDLLDQKYKMGIVSQASGNMYKIMIDGKEYTYNKYINNASQGNIVMATTSGNSVNEVLGITYSYIRNTKIQALDAKRIKINDKVYRFKSDIVIYKRAADDTVTVVSKDDIDVSKTFEDVSLFVDYNSMVKMIVIREQ